AGRGFSRQAVDGRLRGPDRTPPTQPNERVRVLRVRFVRDLLRGLDGNVWARPGEHSDHHRPERVANRLPDPSRGEARTRDHERSLAIESTQLGSDLVDASGSEHDERFAVLAGHARKIGTRGPTHRTAGRPHHARRGGGPGGLKSGLESHAGEPPETGPVIVCGSVGFASLHWTIVPCTTVRSSGAKACTAYTESPHPAVAGTVTVETPAVTVRLPAIPGWILQKSWSVLVAEVPVYSSTT